MPIPTTAIAGGKGGIKTGDIGGASSQSVGGFNGGSNVDIIGAGASSNPFAAQIINSLFATTQPQSVGVSGMGDKILAGAGILAAVTLVVVLVRGRK